MSQKEPIALEVLKELLQKGNNVPIHYQGESMFPLFVSGDVLTVSVQPQIKLGHVVLFSDREGLVSHRVCRIKKKGSQARFYTRGDNGIQWDAILKKEDVLGVVIKRERDGEELDLMSFIHRVYAYLKAWFNPWSVRLKWHLSH